MLEIFQNEEKILENCKQKMSRSYSLFNVSGPPPFDTLGLFTFLRTYARRHNDNDANSTVETWQECLERVVLACNTQLKVGFTEGEMQELFHLLYNLKCSVAGRFLWQLGTKTVDTLGIPSLQNCFRRDTCFITKNGIKSFLNFNDGDTVTVRGKNVWRKATVHNFGKQRLCKLIVVWKNVHKIIYTTLYHKWLVDLRLDWDVYKVVTTEELTHGDFLLSYEREKYTVVDVIETNIEEDVWCVTEPIGECFTLEGGILTHNCAFVKVDKSVEPFTWAMNLLMLGAGVGFRVLPEDIEKLPIVNYALNVRKDTKDADFIVPDSREGWVKLLGRILKSHFYPNAQAFTYSCLLLRSKGAPIKGFGGIASGPEVLCEGMGKIDEILNKRAEKLLRPVDALDIMNIIGMVVVSGNVRRSALLALGDCKDTEYLKAKRWDLGNIPNYRAFSNNSVVCNDIEEVLSNEEFWEGFKGNGEPYGLINLNLSRKCGRLGETKYPDPDVDGYNPCAEQSLNNLESCVTGDTLIHTYENGLKPIKELIGEKVKIFNGKTWSEVVPFLANEQDEFLEIAFNDGSILNVTKYHEFSVSKSRDGEFQKVKAKDLSVGMFLPKFKLTELENVEENVETSFRAKLDVARLLQMHMRRYGANSVIITPEKDTGMAFVEIFSEKMDLRQTVTSITSLKGSQPSYCFTEHLRHMGVFGNVLTYQCCLGELFLPNMFSKEELFKCASYIYRICKHSLTLPCKDSKDMERIVHQNMRMGLGITGYLQATDEQKSWLSDCYKQLRDYDLKYSVQNGFPRSVKLTTCKPSGTLSILGGVTPGVHPGFSQYYKRRVRIASESPLIKLAQEHGYHVEYVKNFDGSLDYTTKIITFPQRLPEGTILAENCPAVVQLEWVKKMQTEWSDNSVSVTIYYKKGELPAIKDWLRKNYNTSIKTVSFLLHSDHGFQQAPMEKISKGEYEELTEKCRNITSVKGVCYLQEDQELIAQNECPGGICPLK